MSASELKRLEDELIRLGLERTAESLRSEAQVRHNGNDLGPTSCPMTDAFLLSSPRPLESSVSEKLTPLAIAQPVVTELPHKSYLTKRYSDSFSTKTHPRANKTVPQFIVCPVRDQVEFKQTELSNKESSTYYEEYPVTPVSFSACSTASKASTRLTDSAIHAHTTTLQENPFTWDRTESKLPQLDLAPVPNQPPQLCIPSGNEADCEPTSPAQMLRSESISRVDSLSRSQEIAETIHSLQLEDTVEQSDEPEDNGTIVSLPESEASPFAAEFVFSSAEPRQESFPTVDDPKNFSFPPTPQGQDAGTGGLNVLSSFNSTRSTDFHSSGTNSSKTTKSPLGLNLSTTSLSSALDACRSSIDLSSPNESETIAPLPTLFQPGGTKKRVSLSLNAGGYDWDSILSEIQTSKAQDNVPLDTLPADFWTNKASNKEAKGRQMMVPRYSFSQEYIDETYDVIDLRIFHKRGKTGFESNKDLYVEPGDIIAGRYQVIKVVGSAVFSKAIKAIDLKQETTVCLKMVKNVKDYFDQSLDEIKLLRYLNKMDPNDEYGVVRLLDFFYYREHLFLVFELLLQNLYEMQQKSIRECKAVTTHNYYFSTSRMKEISRQILITLAFLHSKSIIHSDLKPENVLIKSIEACTIKVIDLGSSCYVTDFLGSYVQSRSYRAPEVVLGVDYDQRIDLWSLGCMLVELATGFVLFQSTSLSELLAKIESVRGPMPQWMIYQGKFSTKYYTTSLKLYRKNPATLDLETLSPIPCSLSEVLCESDTGFVDFVSSLLTPDPNKRPCATEMLEHPWLM